MADNTPVIVSINDGPSITVKQVMGDPKVIPTRVIDLVRDQIVGETLFRNAGNPGSLLVQFQKSKPMFLDGGPEPIAEFGEIPVFDLGEGEPDVARALKIGAAVRISRVMRDYNQIDKVKHQIDGASNTIIRANDTAFREALDDADVPTVAASAAWDTAGAKAVNDVIDAIDLVSTATYVDGDPSQPLGFTPDTLAIHPSNLRAWFKSDDYKALFQGNVAGEHVAFKGALPEKFLGLTVLVSPFWPLDKALVSQRGITGFYADPDPLQGTGLYGEGGGPNGGPTETWRADFTHTRVIGVDEPKSACWITGLR
ncbi:hypothetical protein A5788_22335 [Gordonia sp. 852002-50816_SCH5313054-c]|uniref:phage major capsid protein n=1 Tax=unclassified Gordonia (in: high G+C Gram-positive bacteria) TaxID=2657482 RepID=UPI0007EB066C|nr:MULTISPECIES: hypothetical protein [unclassified Gordonia (in: high G+C Gram-positive bacteria)]OBC12178.1 hypothetical protein A5788_22335 [Gordonia sp. 852002-50816_SCH5313054-c]OBC17603.1 hypothetical protein A5786_18955 [Gordonia sp. 852002-50816_SCH5313054-a]